MVCQIATASEEQSAASGEISRNVEAIAQVAKHSSSAAEEMRAAVEHLTDNARRLDALLQQFRTD